MRPTRKCITWAFLALTLPAGLWAQWPVQLGLQSPNRLLLNPAHAGSQGNWVLGLAYRQQWVGLDGAPRSFAFTGHTGVLKNRSGLGLALVQDQAGVWGQTTVLASYAYRLRLQLGTSRYGFLSAGLHAGMTHHRLESGDLQLLDADDPSLPHARLTSTLPNLGTGLALHTARWFAGASVLHLAEFRHRFTEFSHSESRQVRTFVVYGGGDVATSRYERNLVFSPSVLMTAAANSPLGIDVLLMATLQKRVGLGLGYRNPGSLLAQLQVLVAERFMLAYAYEWVGGSLQGAQSGSHELGLRVRLGDAQKRLLVPVQY